ncbi:MAG: glycoside hydrolase family 28 protein [Clostridia bacterium]|nr:glycoside hydrolase family 28 protein [Clostridia bacterium]
MANGIEEAYGEYDGIIVINAADALNKTGNATCSALTGKQTGIEGEEFRWEIGKEGDGLQEIQLLPVRHSAEYPKSISEGWMWSDKAASEDAPRLIYKINAREEGDYWFSYFSDNPNVGADSFHLVVNGEYRFTTMNAMSGGSDANHAATGAAWFYCDKTAIHLKEGINTIEIRARESGICLRQIMFSKEKPMAARYLYFESQKSVQWLKESNIVTGYIYMNNVEDIELEQGEEKRIELTAFSNNTEAVVYDVKPSNDCINVVIEGNTVKLKGVQSGYTTLQIVASAKDCTDIKMQVKVNVGYKTEGEESDISPKGTIVAPATVMDDAIAFIWEPPVQTEGLVGYNVYLNGIFKEQRGINQTHYYAQNLKADTEYFFCAESVFEDGRKGCGKTVYAKTLQRSEGINITDAPYFAVGDGVTMNTEAIQAAIDDCPKSGTVIIPEGVFLTGALDLKSHITLKIDGELKGSDNPEDYLNPDSNWDLDSTGERIMTRYEGWELLCHKSLLNVGHMNIYNRKYITCENVHIVGDGKITGGGTSLRNRTIDMAKQKGWSVGSSNVYERTRGRLVSVIQSKNVHITGVEISEAPCWTIHMIYSDSVTVHGVDIYSKVLNGDGWDPDSSQNCLLFDADIETGDDCVAIKAGKNPEGDIVKIPSENIKIFDIRCGGGGHGLAMGSEISGGINNIQIRNCKVENTIYGLQLKGTPLRGGYITNLDVRDCTLNMVLIKSNVNYNSDGGAASDKPYFNNLNFTNVIITGEDVNGNALTGSKGAVEISGFDTQCNEHNHLVNNVVFKNVMLGSEKRGHVNINLENCENIVFENVTQYAGNNPSFGLNGVNRDVIYNGLSVTDMQIYDAEVLVSDASFFTRSFSPQTKKSVCSFKVRTKEVSDSFIGFTASNVIPTGWNSFPVIVRLRPEGIFDARNGAEFTYTNKVSYEANKDYFVRVETDVEEKRYNVYVTDEEGETTLLANNFSFRHDAPSINNIGKVCIRGGSGVTSGLFEVEQFSMQNDTTIEIVSVKRNSGNITICAVAFEDVKGRILYAFYNEKEELLCAKIVPLNIEKLAYEEIPVEIPDEYESLKLFAWDDAMKPIGIYRRQC